ncbi:MAG: type II toxin-antitoxin system RelE/ParE family toxin [Micrococcales bacterium]|nr:type II toxin-antitoxin system RelE/ParE family toxin [Micrococcales bacterium]
MTSLPYRLRDAARRDVIDILDHYVDEGAEASAYGFLGALAGAYATITEYPAIGSGRHGEAAGIEGLRTWPVAGFPFLVCYVHKNDEIDVWRVLHMRRDVPGTLAP